MGLPTRSGNSACLQRTVCPMTRPKSFCSRWRLQRRVSRTSPVRKCSTSSVRRNRGILQTDHKAQPCKHCGGSHNPLKCHFRSAKCHYCHKCGHIAAICRQRQQQSDTPLSKPTHTLGAEGTATPPEYNDPMNNIQAVQSPECRKPYVVQVIVHGKPVCMEVDTGATLSIRTCETYLATWGRSTGPTDQAVISARTPVRCLRWLV